MDKDPPTGELPGTDNDWLIPYPKLRKILPTFLTVDRAAHWRNLRKRAYRVLCIDLCLVQRPRQRTRTSPQNRGIDWATDRHRQVLQPIYPVIYLPYRDGKSRPVPCRNQVLPSRHHRVIVDSAS